MAVKLTVPAATSDRGKRMVYCGLQQQCMR